MDELYVGWLVVKQIFTDFSHNKNIPLQSALFINRRDIHIAKLCVTRQKDSKVAKGVS